MSIKKLEDGRYEVDVRPCGRDGKRVRRKFDRKGDAAAFERDIIVRFQTDKYLNQPTDKRNLSEVIETWWYLIGRNHKYAARRLSAVRGVCEEMGDPLICQIDGKALIAYRAARLHRGIKASTINHDLFTLSGVFKALEEGGEFLTENPIAQIKPLKEEQTEMSYFSTDEIECLLSLAKNDYYRIAVLCLATGARWGEAYSLRAENIIHNRVMFTHTKNNGKRAVPISQEVSDIVKTVKTGRLFKVSYRHFRLLMKESKPNLPDGQAAHALRHTFATHFMMRGGNIIALQRILGHADITQTMTYAHFSPDYLSDAVKCNPLSEMSTLRPQPQGLKGGVGV